MIVLALLGCTGDDACPQSDSPTVRIGVGETAYTEHADGAAVPLIYGPQGGVHITLAVEATGFDIDDDLDADIEGQIDGAVLATSSPFVFLRCNNATSTQQAWDLRLIYDVEDPSILDQQVSEVALTLTDANGDASATASTTFVIDDSTN